MQFKPTVDAHPGAASSANAGQPSAAVRLPGAQKKAAVSVCGNARKSRTIYTRVEVEFNLIPRLRK